MHLAMVPKSSSWKLHIQFLEDDFNSKVNRFPVGDSLSFPPEQWGFNELDTAVLKKQQLWQLFHDHSRSPSVLSEASDLSSSFNSRSPPLGVCMLLQWIMELKSW